MLAEVLYVEVALSDQMLFGHIFIEHQLCYTLHIVKDCLHEDPGNKLFVVTRS